MIGVILERVSRQRVREHGQAFSVHHEPGEDASELLGIECELAASARMRTDGLVVHAPNRKIESLAGCRAELAGLLAGSRILMNIDMITCDAAQSAERHLCQPKIGPPLKRA